MIRGAAQNFVSMIKNARISEEPPGARSTAAVMNGWICEIRLLSSIRLWPKTGSSEERRVDW